MLTAEREIFQMTFAPTGLGNAALEVPQAKIKADEMAPVCVFHLESLKG